MEITNGNPLDQTEIKWKGRDKADLKYLMILWTDTDSRLPAAGRLIREIRGFFRQLSYMYLLKP